MIILIAIVSVTSLTIMQAFTADYDMDSDQTTAFNRATTGVTYFDTIQFLIIGGLSASLIYTAFKVRTHPVFFFINLILLVVVVFTTPVFSNMLTSFMDDDGMSTATASFPLTVYIRDNLPVILLVIGLVFMVALYAKYVHGGGGGNVYES